MRKLENSGSVAFLWANVIQFKTAIMESES